jgi:hypothetical protein
MELFRAIAAASVWALNSKQCDGPAGESIKRRNQATIRRYILLTKCPKSIRQLFFFAHGEGLFSGPDFHPQEFYYQPLDVQQNHILVPGRAVAVFQVSLFISSEFGQDGDNVSTSIEVDFNTGSYGIFCPFVLVDALGNAAAAAAAT